MTGSKLGPAARRSSTRPAGRERVEGHFRGRVSPARGSPDRSVAGTRRAAPVRCFLRGGGWAPTSRPQRSTTATSSGLHDGGPRGRVQRETSRRFHQCMREPQNIDETRQRRPPGAALPMADRPGGITAPCFWSSENGSESVRRMSDVFAGDQACRAIRASGVNRYSSGLMRCASA